MSVLLRPMIWVFITAYVFLVALIITPNCDAEEAVPVKIVTTIGTSTIYGGDVGSARNHAIENSLVSAISLVSTDLLSSDTITQDFEVLSNILYNRTNEFIQGYKVLNSARSGRQYSVIVEAAVALERVESQLSDVGIIFLKHALPKVLFFITEQDLSNPQPKYWWGEDAGFFSVFSENMMAIAFQEKGFPVIDHDILIQDMMLDPVRYKPGIDTETALALGVHFKADVVVIGSTSVQIMPNRMGENIKSYRANMVARAFAVDTGTKIGMTERQFTAVGDNDIAGGEDALSGVGQIAGSELAQQLIDVWQNKLKTLIGIEAYIKWKGNLSDYVELRRAIVAIPGVKRILPREMSGDEAIITVDFEGGVKALADALIVHNFSSFGIDIYEISENHISIELLPLESQAPAAPEMLEIIETP